MPGALAHRLGPAIADPGSATAHDCAAEVLRELARKPAPGRADRALMDEHALLFTGLGLADEARALLRSWRRSGTTSPGLQRAEILHNVTVAPGSAAALLRELGASDPQIAALAVVNALFRGELPVAIETARASSWFLDDGELAHGLFHAVWALGLSDRFAEAHQVIDDWKRRNPHPPPMARHLMLRVEAGLASFEHRYSAEEALVEEALAVCLEHEVGIAEVYTTSQLVGACARSGQLTRAREVSRDWPRRRRAARGPIEAYRDVATLELALLSGRAGPARTAARRALPFFERTGHAVMTCHVRFRRALAAGPDEFDAELAELRQAVRRCPILHYSQRLRLLDELVAGTGSCARDIELVERSRRARVNRDLARVWSPPVTVVGADLFWNRVSGSLHVRGRGPHSLGRRPVLRRLLEEILARDELAATVPDLFTAVWGGSYNPIRHEGKVHVALHRLRSWLDDCADGAGSMIELIDGVVAIAPSVDVRVLETPHLPARELPRSVRDRVLQCVQDGTDPLTPGELQRRLGVSRPAVNVALRALVADGRIIRLGRGRATRYARGDRRAER
jgi:hypothetical protein